MSPRFKGTLHTSVFNCPLEYCVQEGFWFGKITHRRGEIHYDIIYITCQIVLVKWSNRGICDSKPFQCSNEFLKHFYLLFFFLNGGMLPNSSPKSFRTIISFFSTLYSSSTCVSTGVQLGLTCVHMG